MTKNLCNLSNGKFSSLLSFIIGVVWGGGWGDRVINKCNRENYWNISKCKWCCFGDILL